MLHQALSARSYNKELILVANSLHRLDGLVQLVADLKALGYGHTLVLSHDR